MDNSCFVNESNGNGKTDRGSIRYLDSKEVKPLTEQAPQLATPQEIPQFVKKPFIAELVQKIRDMVSRVSGYLKYCYVIILLSVDFIVSFFVFKSFISPINCSTY
jgi:hypothetical protein